MGTTLNEHWDNYRRKPAMTLAEFEAYEARNRARFTLRAALKRGSVEPTPCMCCGAPAVQAHHPDYDNALGVVWLCRPHHEQVHHPAPGDARARRWAAALPQDAFL